MCIVVSQLWLILGNVLCFIFHSACVYVYSIAMQAFAVPLQGFVNALLFVLLSKVIVCRLMNSCLCCRKNNSGEQKLLQKIDEDRQPLFTVTRKKKNDTPTSSNAGLSVKYGAMPIQAATMQ